MAELSLHALQKRYGPLDILHGLDLEVRDGEFIVLVGPSGCGKSTLLRMIAGLDTVSSGELRIGGKRANDLPPQKRNIAMVFQSYALFPHMSVRDNILYGPKVRGDEPAKTESRLKKAADILNLGPYLDRKPAQLSGGQRQRVAMGRAIMREPDLFLFDEPLSNLDAKLRMQMRTEIKALHQTLGSTIVYVTHDQIEAMTMADRIVVMNAGRIEQVGAPLELYDRPANIFVAGFLGSPPMNLLPARRGGDGVLALADMAFGTGGPALPLVAPATEGTDFLVGIRPERFRRAGDGGLPLKVGVVEPTGAETHVYGTIGETAVRVVLSERVVAQPGEILPLAVAPDDCHLFEASSGRRVERALAA
ncbi:ABC transporter ATP-binding protein [Aureimonas sp. D3]|uniref:ABC transporter ATP-binding protein n=1 Tax=Aureimonas sp. D3 TaxID=1638164 RepID=UPI0007856353|nr:sn-glycerol-3-phosphate ABC transporter ATP-binding protein UgpC [Aureimonas sp. D3]